MHQRRSLQDAALVLTATTESAEPNVTENPDRGEQRPLPLWRQAAEAASLDYHWQRVAAYEAVHTLHGKGADVADIARLLQADADIAAAYAVTQDFAAMLRPREGERHDAWTETAAQSGSDDLKRVALGLRDDYAAVQAGLTLQ